MNRLPLRLEVSGQGRTLEDAMKWARDVAEQFFGHDRIRLVDNPRAGYVVSASARICGLDCVFEEIDTQTAVGGDG